MVFKNKTLLITGGTGSFGNALLDRFVSSNYKEIRIFSRDEKKQDDMRKKYSNSKIKFYIGDVRDINSINNAMDGVDFIFHAAALKQVPSCEFYPIEALKTNVLGTENVLNSAIYYKVKKIVCLSTDKAVYPINAMGISKAMMEKVIVAKSRVSKNTIICVTRYGNVMASRGSVIPLFVEQIKANKPISITDSDMTRFMMTLDDAIDLVLYAFKNGKSGETFIQKAPAASISNLVKALCEVFKKPNHMIKIIGTRHGEKAHEVLMSREERIFAEELTSYFKIPPDLRDLNYDLYYMSGKKNLKKIAEYSSFNTKQLDVQNLKKLLMKVNYIRESL
jgi:UDP-N-acetylglucosamine 4,6-dehydratase/5-epimerase